MKASTVAIVANSTWNLLNFRQGLIRAFQERAWRVILLAPDGPERPTLEATGATFFSLKYLQRRSQNPLQDGALTWELTRHYRRHQVDVVLHFTIKPVIFGSFAARFAGVANISTLTGLGYTFLAGTGINMVVRMLYRLALRSATTVFFHNPDDRNLFVSDGLVRKDRAKVVPGSGIRLEEYPLSDYEVAVPKRFLFVGRLLSDKGIREFIAAAQLAKAEDASLSFHVLGPLDSDNPAGISAAELASWTADDTIIYEGETKDVRPHLRNASVVVLPSYREGCPRVLLEAAATGRAIIGTDVPGVREVVVPEVNGWLVPSKSPEALAAAFLLAAQSSSLLPKLGEAGQQLVKVGFSEAIVVEAYLKELEKLGLFH